ncbi:DNA polymerase subunit gamma-2, mitochondrial isoform X2 [Electrophorus electricus]|uniref:DNA polymerase subunit gamma-2, mitochondrial isoform X2 n=1 Tax=Electrophorus electricus TaxID=8005 RepID=UPI0015CF9F2B|nr:DNA polymerase subunit gamma-2, mitochondrial isoform X2 [Electrophorus electricus]
MIVTYCIRRRLSLLRRETVTVSFLHELLRLPQHYRRTVLSHYSEGTSNDVADPASMLLQLCGRHYYIAPGAIHSASLKKGRGCGYGPLGLDLKQNVLEQWWTSVVRSRAQVFGISTLHSSMDGAAVKMIQGDAVRDMHSQTGLTEEHLAERLRQILQHKEFFRTSLLQGALERYVPSMELVNRKLPFGLAQTGLCYQPETADSDAVGCSSEVTEACLVWFCSPRTSSQWLDYWTRQRLQWWRKFALGPSDFSVRNVSGEDLRQGIPYGVEVLYQFPWGTEVLETLWNLGDTELLNTHQHSKAQLQCKDGRKVVLPHVIAVTANMDRGVLAYLSNSLQHVQKMDNKQRLHQRKVLKLHPVLAPVKVALDMARGPTSELRQYKCI